MALKAAACPVLKKFRSHGALTGRLVGKARMSDKGAFLGLLQNSADLADGVLSHLSPAGLATLQCTCRAAQAAVCRLPEAVWQVSTCVCTG